MLFRSTTDIFLAVSKNRVYRHNPKSDQLKTIRTLINFDRVFLKAGESKKLTFNIEPKQLAQLNSQNKFELEAGNMILSVGGMQASPERIKEKKVIQNDMVLVGKTTIF